MLLTEIYFSKIKRQMSTFLFESLRSKDTLKLNEKTIKYEYMKRRLKCKNVTCCGAKITQIGTLKV
jgi:hypothetical protein